MDIDVTEKPALAALAAPYVKDYDAADGWPLGWSARFDLARWALVAARLNGRRVGGAAAVVRA